jgi:putative transposase
MKGIDSVGIVKEIDFDKDKIRKFDKNIDNKQRNLSHKKRFSNLWLLAKTKLEATYKRKENYQEDIIKKAVNELAQGYDSITIEDLNMAFVMKNKRMARNSANHPYYKFKIFAFNKLNQSNKKLYQVPNSFASTQICSCCGNRLEGSDKMLLKDRIYKCKICNMELDRDLNAAKNILMCPEKQEFLGY